MSDFKWLKANTIERGDTIRIASHDLEVTDVKRGSEYVYVTTKVGHDGKPDQEYKLTTWQELEVSK